MFLEKKRKIRHICYCFFLTISVFMSYSFKRHCLYCIFFNQAEMAYNPYIGQRHQEIYPLFSIRSMRVSPSYLQLPDGHKSTRYTACRRYAYLQPYDLARHHRPRYLFLRAVLGRVPPRPV